MASTAPAPAPETSLHEDLGKARRELATEVVDPPPVADDPEVDDEDLEETDEEPDGDDDEDDDEEPEGAAAASTAGKKHRVLENATAEELATIRANPILAKLEKSMVRDYKAKTGTVAQQRRELEAQRSEFAQAKELADALRDNPEEMIASLARKRGMTVAKATKVVKEAVEAIEVDPELKELFGDDAAAIQPHFNKVLDKRIDEKMKPALERLERISDAEFKAEVKNDIRAFQNELSEAGEEVTPEIEAEMQRLTKMVDPGVDPETGKQLSTKQYVALLYKLATSGQSASTITKKVVDRMRKAVERTPPTDVPTGGAGPGTAITKDMSFRESLRVARKEVLAGR